MRLIIALSFSFLFISILSAQYEGKMSGITLVAPRDSFSLDPMPALIDVNCEWVAVIPYAFTPPGETTVRFGQYQWWGESPHGAEETIKLAKTSGLKVMLKPQVWMHHGWVGDMDYASDKEWHQWEEEYKAYILRFAEIASRQSVEVFCIGTEFKIALQKREAFWFDLIKSVREIYDGMISYCANWDEFEDVGIWKELDLIGVSAYFPLIKDETPDIDALVKAWKPIKKRIQKLSYKFGKPVFFAEYGYLSLDGSTWNNWELEKRRMDVDVNELAQANALEAMYKSFYNEKFWAGGFLWKWYPEGHGRRRYRDRDYTPQGKMAENVIRQWHSEINKKQFYLTP